MLLTNLYCDDERGLRARTALETQGVPILDVRLRGAPILPVLRLCTAGREEIEALWTPEGARRFADLDGWCWRLDQWTRRGKLPARRFASLCTVPLSVLRVPFDLDEPIHLAALETAAQTGVLAFLRYDAPLAAGNHARVLGAFLGRTALDDLQELLVLAAATPLVARMPAAISGAEAAQHASRAN